MYHYCSLRCLIPHGTNFTSLSSWYYLIMFQLFSNHFWRAVSPFFLSHSLFLWKNPSGAFYVWLVIVISSGSTSCPPLAKKRIYLPLIFWKNIISLQHYASSPCSSSHWLFVEKLILHCSLSLFLCQNIRSALLEIPLEIPPIWCFFFLCVP